MAPGLAVLGRRGLHQHRRGGGDPTFRSTRTDGLARHPDPGGPHHAARPGPPARRDVLAQAWGPGATWVLESVPALLGAEDDWSGSSHGTPCCEEVRRHHPHLRLGRTGLVMEALVPAIIEQKVTGKEAFAGFRALVHRFGERAPGPGVERRLWLQPTPDTLRTIPSWEWLRLHIDPARSRAIVTAAKVAVVARTHRGPTRGGGGATARSLPGSGSGPAPRCASGPSVTRTRCGSATTTSPRTSAGR